MTRVPQPVIKDSFGHIWKMKFSSDALPTGEMRLTHSTNKGRAPNKHPRS